MLPAAEPLLLATSIVLHLARGSELGRRVEATYAFGALAVNPLVSIVTEGELRSLALQFGWGAGKQARLEEILGRALVVPLEYEGVVEAYARIDHYCRQIGRPVGENDVWIAASAHATGARLVTTDRDFDALCPRFIRRDWIDPQAR